MPSRYPSAASTSDAVAASAGRRTTSTSASSAGSVAPRSTASNSSAVAGDGVWCTISSRGMPASLPQASDGG